MNATVQVGAIHLFSDVTTRDNFTGLVTAQADLEFGDALTPISNSITNGALEPFLFTLNLRYSATAAPDSHAINLGHVGLFFENTFAGTFGGDLGGRGSMGQLTWFATDGDIDSGVKAFTVTVNLPVGQSSWFVERLVSRNFQSGNGGTPPGDNALDIADTAWLTIASLNPDVSFTTSSGYAYVGDPDAPVTPVPEPSSLLLTASGVVGVLRRYRPRLSWPLARC